MYPRQWSGLRLRSPFSPACQRVRSMMRTHFTEPPDLVQWAGKSEKSIKHFARFFSSVPSLSRFASFWKQETGFKANQIGSTSGRMSFRDFTNEAELLLGSVSKRRNDRSLPEGFVPSLCRLKRER